MDERRRVVEALKVAATIVAIHGQTYLPIFQRLERKLDDIDQGSDSLIRAMSIARRETVKETCSEV